MIQVTRWATNFNVSQEWLDDIVFSAWDHIVKEVDRLYLKPSQANRLFSSGIARDW